MQESNVNKPKSKNLIWKNAAFVSSLIIFLGGCSAPVRPITAVLLPARTPSYSAEEEGYYLGDATQVEEDSPSARKAPETPVATPPTEIEEHSGCVLSEPPTTTEIIVGKEMTQLPMQNSIGALYNKDGTFMGVISGRGGGYVMKGSIREFYLCEGEMDYLDSEYFRQFVRDVFDKHLSASSPPQSK